MESFQLVTPVNDQTRTVYITGGFARNEIFVKLIAACLPEKKVFTSEIDNATALGAAIVVWESPFRKSMPVLDLALQECRMV